MKLDRVRHVGIIGTGMIGTSAAVLMTGHGYKTTVLSMSDELTAASRKTLDAFYAQIVEAGRMTEEEAAICKSYLHYTTDYADLKDCSHIWECVLEKTEIKHEVFRAIEEHCDQVEILMSSTSAIPPNDLVPACKKYADRLLVAHPINPPHLVPYIEMIVPTTVESQPDLVSRTREFFLSLDRKPVLLKKSIDGFFATRLHLVLLREAFQLAQDGVADMRDIDTATMFGVTPRFMTSGLMEQLDFEGLDHVVSDVNAIFPVLSTMDHSPQILLDAFNAGHYGVKSGHGFYDWSNVDMAEFKNRIAAPWWDLFHWDIPKAAM